MSIKTKLADCIEAKKDLFTSVNDKIWEYAEIAFDEHKSSDLLCSVLKEEGFEVKKGDAVFKLLEQKVCIVSQN